MQINNLSVGYGKNLVLHNISFSLNNRETVALIGQNGSGKSTFLKTIARIISDNSGDIIFDGMSLNNFKTWELKDKGISFLTQGGMILSTLTVKEHFKLALRDKSNIADSIKEECLSEFPKLKTLMGVRGGNLSGGERQMLSFAMLMAQQTKCWLLDEPTAGLSPDAVNETETFLSKIKLKANISIILVEHNYPVAFRLADHVAIIKEGKVYNSFVKEEFQKTDFLNKYLYN